MYKKWLYSGSAIFLFSITVGIIATVWNVYRSFEELERNESAGIGAVGKSIENALAWNILALFGVGIGIVMISVGIYKRYRR